MPEAIRSSSPRANAKLRSVALRTVPRGDGFPVGVLVLPPDRRGEPLVMDRVGHRRPGPRALLALLDVEGPPFRALVDHLIVEDESALLAGQLPALVVERQVPAVALGTPSDLFGFFDFLVCHRSSPGRGRLPSRASPSRASP